MNKFEGNFTPQQEEITESKEAYQEGIESSKDPQLLIMWEALAEKKLREMIKLESVPVSEEDFNKITDVSNFEPRTISGEVVDGVYRNKDGSSVIIDGESAIVRYPDGRSQITEDAQGVENAKKLIDKNFSSEQFQYNGILRTIRSTVIRTVEGDFYYVPKDNDKSWQEQEKKKMTDEQKKEFLSRFPFDKLAELYKKAKDAAWEEVKEKALLKTGENPEKKFIDTL